MLQSISYWISSLAASYSRYLPQAATVIVVVLVAIIAVIIYLMVVHRRRAAEKEEIIELTEPAEEPKPAAAPPASARTLSKSLRASFSQGLKTLKENTSGRNYRYSIPWFMMIGEAGSGKTTALGNTGLNLPIGRPEHETPGRKEGLNWWFYDRGIVLDVMGDYVLESDGKSSDKRGWRSLLKLLVKKRPKRPIDGVILAIPADDLLDFSPEGLNWIGSKAELILRKLLSVQKTLAMRFPVYVVITKCDKIEGFGEFSRGLTNNLRQDMFGWSNPYSMETAYSTGWVDEARENILSKLLKTQVEVFAQGADPRDRDGLFMFPENFKAVWKPLRVYLDRLFSQSVYHESFLFRGVYFTGDTEDKRLKIEQKSPVFLRNLFNNKVFPEYSLARPVSKISISRNRTVLATQALAVLISLVWGIGLWFAYDELKDSKGSLLSVLKTISVDLEEQREKELKYKGKSLMIFKLLREESERTPFKERALHLFKGMTDIKTSSLSSPFVPSSWFSTLHEDIRRSITKAYDAIILKALYIQLNLKLKEVLGPSIQAKKHFAKAPEIVDFDKFPDFVEMRDFVDRLQVFESHADLYNGLKKSKDLDDLGKVVTYLFDMVLPQGFYTNAEYYHEALKNVEYRSFEPRIFRFKARIKFKIMSGNLFRTLFDSGLITRDLDEFTKRLAELKSKMRGADRGDQIRALQMSIVRIRDVLHRPELSWMSHPEFLPGTGYQKLLADAGALELVGPELRLEVQRRGEKSFLEFKEKLGGYNTHLLGSVLDRHRGIVQMKLSPPILAVGAALDELLGSRFMTVEEPGAATFGVAEYKPGVRLEWDPKLLEEAVELYHGYKEFVEVGLKSFPGELQSIVQAAAKKKLKARMTGLIAEAQMYKTGPTSFTRDAVEEEISIDIRNFKQVSGLLDTILNIFDRRLDLGDAYINLSNLVESQAYALLAAVDRLVDKDLYSVKGGDFSWWDGVQALSFEAFDARDEREMDRYLEAQRARIKHLAYSYAEPLVMFLLRRPVPGLGSKARLLLSWERIITELDKYDKKMPGNSVAVLEKFIRADIDKIKPANYYELISRKELKERSGDYFIEKRNNLRRELYKRCQKIAADVVAKRYAKLEAFFNRRLAGKFPFSTVGEGKELIEANPGDVRDFYLLFDKYGKGAKEVLTGYEKFGVSGQHTAEFLDSIENARGVFAPFLKGEEMKAPELDVAVDFRVNRAKEVNGDQIIDWKMNVGDHKFSYRDPTKQGRWRFGDPVRLYLRWAKNSPLAPSYTAKDPWSSVDGKTVVYDYTNNWSLFSLLKRHASNPEDFPGYEDPKPHSLKFVIATKSADQDATEDEDTLKSETKVFVRVSIMVPDKKEGTTLVTLPDRAPHLDVDTGR